jgi:hypothetical protein
MFKINFVHTVYYLSAKYIIFFVILAFVRNRFQEVVINHAQTSSELFKLSLGYVLYVLFYIAIMVVIFCTPLYYIILIKNGLNCLLLLVAFYAIEFLAYWFLFSPSDIYMAVYNAVIGMVFLNLFFFQQLVVKFNK